MNMRKFGAVLFGVVTIAVTGFTIYKVSIGETVGFNEIFIISLLFMIFLSAITWGTKKNKDGIVLEEELGQRITEKSAKISYYILIVVIFGAIFADKLINETINIFLLLILGIAMVLLPFVEHLVARKYQ